MFEGLFQPLHLVIILVIALIIFGPGKLSEVGGSLGKAIRGFKKALNEPMDENKNVTHIEGKDDQKTSSSPR